MSWLGELSDFGPAPLAVDVYWESYPGKKAHVWQLWQQTGWMQVVRVSLETPVSSHEEIITLFCNDMGQPMPAWLGNRLFDMRSSIPTYMHHEPPEELEDQADALYWDFLGRCDRKNLAELEAADDALSDDILDVEAEALAGVTQIDDFIGALRREKRHPDCRPERKPEIDARIAELQPFKPKLLATIPGAIKALRDDYQQYEDDVFESVTIHGRIDPLYTVRWTMRSLHMPPLVNVSPWTEERFMGNLNVGTRWKENYRAGHRIDVSPEPPKTRANVRTKREVKAALIKMAQDKNAEARHKTGLAQASPTPRKRGRPPGAKNKVLPIKPIRPFQAVTPLVNTPSESASVLKPKHNNAAIPTPSQTTYNFAGWVHRERKRQIKSVLRANRRLDLSKTVISRIGRKEGPSLKTALIGLANNGLITTDNAVDLFKVLSALNAHKQSKENN